MQAAPGRTACSKLADAGCMHNSMHTMMTTSDALLTVCLAAVAGLTSTVCGCPAATASSLLVKLMHAASNASAQVRSAPVLSHCIAGSSARLTSTVCDCPTASASSLLLRLTAAGGTPLLKSATVCIL
jgi:hypothetical protein